MDGFFDDVIVNGKEWNSGGEKSVLRGSHIFVCAHGSRDVRCGVCGPVLLDKLNEEIQLRGLKDQISVVACSHVGGHKYAGNVIIFCPGPDGKITGNWSVFTLLYVSYISLLSFKIILLYIFKRFFVFKIYISILFKHN